QRERPEVAAVGFDPHLAPLGRRLLEQVEDEGPFAALQVHDLDPRLGRDRRQDQRPLVLPGPPAGEEAVPPERRRIGDLPALGQHVGRMVGVQEEPDLAGRRLWTAGSEKNEGKEELERGSLHDNDNRPRILALKSCEAEWSPAQGLHPLAPSPIPSLPPGEGETTPGSISRPPSPGWGEGMGEGP